MKLLLTSSGLTNESIVTALVELLNQPLDRTKLAFIPTAANIEEGDKSWVIDDLNNCRKCGFSEIDIVDFSAIPQDEWLPRFETADVLLFEGGNTSYLLKKVLEHGLAHKLPELLKSKVYVGISAGSMITAPRVSLSYDKILYHEETGHLQEDTALNYVKFQIRPHLNSPIFPKVTGELLSQIATEIPDTFYAIDDQTAIQVIDGQIRVVSEGLWKKYN